MSLMAANEESDPSAILNGFWVTLFFIHARISYTVHLACNAFACFLALATR